MNFQVRIDVFFHGLRGSDVPVNDACFLCGKQRFDGFPKPRLLLKLCHRSKFGNDKFWRVERDKCWFCLVWASLQALSLGRKHCCFIGAPWFFTWLAPLAVWILGYKLCVFFMLINTSHLKCIYSLYQDQALCFCWFSVIFWWLLCCTGNNQHSLLLHGSLCPGTTSGSQAWAAWPWTAGIYISVLVQLWVGEILAWAALWWESQPVCTVLKVLNELSDLLHFRRQRNWTFSAW